MTSQESERIRSLLCQLGERIRDVVISQRTKSIDELSAIAGHTAADTIYQIDRISEDAIVEWFDEHWPSEIPCQVVMEGIEESERLAFPRSASYDAVKVAVLLDPIDGTRGIMYDKRSAWALAAAAPMKPDGARLKDVFAAAMTELPTSKQNVVEQLSFSLDAPGAARAFRVSKNLSTGLETPLPPTPSQATDLRHGFASVAKYFPAAKKELAALEEDMLRDVIPADEWDSAIVFDDQYISTGGQLYELIAGHDRFILDVRPQMHAALGLDEALACHPYDICVFPIACAAGVIVESPDGSPLDAPFDTTTPVSWVGYANETLANQIRPALHKAMQKHFTSSN